MFREMRPVTCDTSFVSSTAQKPNSGGCGLWSNHDNHSYFRLCLHVAIYSQRDRKGRGQFFASNCRQQCFCIQDKWQYQILCMCFILFSILIPIQENRYTCILPVPATPLTVLEGGFVVN